MSKTAAKPLSVRAYAKHRGVSHTAVQQAIASKRLTKSVRLNTRGNPEIISAARADAEWDANTDQSKPRNSVSGAAKPAAEDASEPEQRGPNFQQSRAIREAYLARLAKLEWEEKSGKLINADAVSVAAFNAGRKMRDALFNIPDRISDILAGISDGREVHRILTEEIRRVAEKEAKGAAAL